ncbi:benzoate/H(+) symporter BenE family transporter [Arthrobacter burdickii]|uniref:Benzoate/H(+) symporter BenE family transporter n=1 Tax=Arthrobacter burdickii TaxID=3035920 RepID=A0ABT8K5B0_9MICC|nr:benzoate/H(+) symporter BenE family transporter [Arthrobacter burdickii]MDN4612202.1 benzoate/H(+) symporter BenE family transporter [Arthrobacter burdickii]
MHTSTAVRPGLHEPVLAGVVTALVGFTSSFAVVLAGLRVTGATPEQAASGLLALTAVVGVGIVLLSLRYRLPITLSWSTPGAALLAGASIPAGGWPAAVGAFLVTGVLIALTGAVPWLGRLVARIPQHLAQAMLAGVLLPLCLAPFQSLGSIPLLVLPVIAVWLAASALVPKWAVPLALAAALAVIGFQFALHGTVIDPSSLAPTLTVTLPTLDPAAVVGIALPLYVVTMASQNLPGVAVLASFGYRAPWRPALAVTGLGTAVVAPFGGHAVNLAALSAALSAGEGAGEDRDRRWIAALTAGVSYLVLAGVSGALVVVVGAAPAGLVEAVAGLALIGTMATAVTASFSDARGRMSGAVTFLLAASGLSVLGIGGAFWALVGGLLVRAVLERKAPRA